MQPRPVHAQFPKPHTRAADISRHGVAWQPSFLIISRELCAPGWKIGWQAEHQKIASQWPLVENLGRNGAGARTRPITEVCERAGARCSIATLASWRLPLKASTLRKAAAASNGTQIL